MLYDTRAAFKMYVASVAMHISMDDRARLFRQLDLLLDSEEWDSQDAPPTLASFQTYMRLMLTRRPTKQPSIGATFDGHLIAAWQNERGRLTIECLANDRIRWSVIVTVEAAASEVGGGETVLARFGAVLEPYTPARWLA